MASYLKGILGTVLLFFVVGLLGACGRSPRALLAPGDADESSLTASVSGVKQDLREDIPLVFKLLCGPSADKLAVVATAPDPGPAKDVVVVAFKGVKAKEGDVCSLEVQAENLPSVSKEDFEWLTGRTGTFYVGTAQKLGKERKLAVDLYSVFRYLPQNVEDVDLTVSAKGVGECAAWDDAARECRPVTPAIVAAP